MTQHIGVAVKLHVYLLQIFLNSSELQSLNMLYFATVVLTLLGVSFCQDFKTDYLSMVDDLGFQYDYGLWKPIATVDEGKGCCLPPEMEVMEGMMLAEAGGRREGETDCPGGNCPRAPKVIMVSSHPHSSRRVFCFYTECFSCFCTDYFSCFYTTISSCLHSLTCSSVKTL